MFVATRICPMCSHTGPLVSFVRVDAGGKPAGAGVTR
jgi:hypothetical protein